LQHVSDTAHTRLGPGELRFPNRFGHVLAMARRQCTYRERVTHTPATGPAARPTTNPTSHPAWCNWSARFTMRELRRRAATVEARARRGANWGRRYTPRRSYQFVSFSKVMGCP
jgi:hypothetical protein